VITGLLAGPAGRRRSIDRDEDVEEHDLLLLALDRRRRKDEPQN
jgi:hypothetical protein